MTKSTKIVAALGVVAGIGVAALPLGTYAEDLIPLNYATGNGKTEKPSVNTTVKLSVGEAITIASNKTECDAGELTVNGEGSCEMLVAGGTNAQNGFILTVKDTDDQTSLKNDNGSTADTAFIKAVDGDLTPGMAYGGWNITGGALEKKAITIDEQTVLQTSGAKDAQATMTYNFATQRNQEKGDYSDKIVYTVAKNDAAVAEEVGTSAAGVTTTDGND